MEIGVQYARSIEMYLQYFENPYVVGMDSGDKSHFCNGKWKFVRGDQSKIQDLQNVVSNEEPFDIILDDGGHKMKQQQISLGFLIDYVKPGGIYIIEDLHTSLHGNFRDLLNPNEITTLSMLEKIKNKQIPFSCYIDVNQQRKILEKIKFLEIYKLRPQYSYTSIITLT